MNKYNRIVLKVSGEALAGGCNHGICDDGVVAVAEQIKKVVELGVQVGVVVGGGNFWRGRTCDDMNRATADYIGMMATVMNGLALGEGLTAMGVKNKVVSSLAMEKVCETYFLPNVRKYLDEGYVVIFVGGTGSPFFSTDTAAALRAAEIGADALLKATNVDGIYTKDPKKYEDAEKIAEITYLEVLNKKLNVMDTTATTLCMDNDIPIIVFDINEKGNLKQVIEGKKIGTIVKK
jgi:uridylate kinase